MKNGVRLEVNMAVSRRRPTGRRDKIWPKNWGMGNVLDLILCTNSIPELNCEEKAEKLV